MKEIKQGEIKNTSVTVPGSKSYTHRILIATALADGPSIIENTLKSEDTTLTANALKSWGVQIIEKNGCIEVTGTRGELKSAKEPVYLANSGTSMRLLTGIAALGNGKYILTGSERMQERPIRELLDGLSQIGIKAISLNNSGCPPVEIQGSNLKGGEMALDCRVSSQYLSSVLLMAPCTEKGIRVTLPYGLVSKPYVDMTVDIMNRLNVSVERDGYDSFFVPGDQMYRHGRYVVEPDCSQASYFWAAAAITGKTVKVNNISMKSRQGDVKFVGVLEKMGCIVKEDKEGISVTGGKLKAVETDMSNMPDVVPTLAVVAAFSEGTTIIKNVSHLKAKECDRIGSVAKELTKMGIAVKTFEDGLAITGGKPGGAIIETYNDHRMAMCFAVAGLVVSGIFIKDETCVVKSFPNYWDVFEGMYAS
ncbi:MAG: 3-phosphoshikimate 1-carboxyvinyltransferase [Proteobacteria bacterium]|nr:3-phosphoshikimate 1-carboxyvinyltransferase [Pseudomonadota bacterium]